MPVRIARFLPSLFAFWLVAPAFAQPDLQIRVLQREAVALAPSRPGDAALEVTAVHFAGSGWDREAIESAFRQSAAILAQCGMVLARVDFVLLDAPREFQFYVTPVSRTLARSMPLPRPTVYFVRDTLNRPAFDAEAIGRSNSRSRPELLNTVWVALGTPDLGIALAHELAHLLMDSGAHVDAPGNLMRAETHVQNTRLDAGQCARLRDSGRQGDLLK